MGFQTLQKTDSYLGEEYQNICKCTEHHLIDIRRSKAGSHIHMHTHTHTQREEERKEKERAKKKERKRREEKEITVLKIVLAKNLKTSKE